MALLNATKNDRCCLEGKRFRGVWIVFIVFAILAVLSLPKQATSNSVTNYVITTNIVTAAESFRVVRGQLYNSAIAAGWRQVHAECRAVLTNVVVVQEFEVKRLYEEPRTTPLGRIGAFTGGGGPSRVLKQWREYGRVVAITNYEWRVFVGDTLYCTVLPVGDFQWKDNKLELLDRGIRNQSIVDHNEYVREPAISLSCPFTGSTTSQRACAAAEVAERMPETRGRPMKGEKKKAQKRGFFILQGG